MRFNGDACTLEQGQVKVGDRCMISDFQMLVTLDSTRTLANHCHWQWEVVVRITVTHIAAISKNGIIQQVSFRRPEYLLVCRQILPIHRYARFVTVTVSGD